ncbi:MAG: hypothetical protein ACOYVK_02380 [Bacillota bacterium]
MLNNKSFETILFVKDNCMRFYVDQHKHLHYDFVNGIGPIKVFDEEILEYDIEMNAEGKIGIAILDKSGGLHYYHYDGVEWQSQLLYHVDVSKEDICYIQLKFSKTNVYILFCWNNVSNPKQWSIVCYYTKGNNWDKEVFSRIYLKNRIKPYILIRDHQDQLYLLYLTNNNLIYNIQMQMLSKNAASWSSPKLISNCIYVNSFYLDAVIDNDHTLHLCWCDKQKQSYCIKYLSLDTPFTAAIAPLTLLQSKTPYIRSMLYIEKQSAACFGFTGSGLDYAIKMKQNPTHKTGNWKTGNTQDWDLSNLKVFKTIFGQSHPNNSYHGNYILTDDSQEFTPIQIFREDQSMLNEVHATSDEHTFIIDQSKTQDKEILQLKRLRVDNFKLNQELLTKNNIIKSYENEIQFLREKVKKLENDYKTLSQTIETSQKKIKDQADSLRSHTNTSEKLEAKNKELLKEISLYQQKIGQLNAFVEELRKENQHYKEELEDMANRGLFRRIFT